MLIRQQARSRCRRGDNGRSQQQNRREPEDSGGQVQPHVLISSF